jgi:hypothetical protein
VTRLLPCPKDWRGSSISSRRTLLGCQADPCSFTTLSAARLTFRCRRPTAILKIPSTSCEQARLFEVAQDYAE